MEEPLTRAASRNRPAISAATGLTRRRFPELTGTGAAGLLVGWLIRRPAQAIHTAGQDLGLLHRRWSTPGYSDALSAVLCWGRRPPLYKDNAWAERRPLPQVETPPAMPLAELARLLYGASGTWRIRAEPRPATQTGPRKDKRAPRR